MYHQEEATNFDEEFTRLSLESVDDFSNNTQFEGSCDIFQGFDYEAPIYHIEYGYSRDVGGNSSSSERRKTWSLLHRQVTC